MTLLLLLLFFARFGPPVNATLNHASTLCSHATEILFAQTDPPHTIAPLPFLFILLNLEVPVTYLITRLYDHT